jgi:diguanylate cyclase (GGDEF)-like protein
LEDAVLLFLNRALSTVAKQFFLRPDDVDLARAQFAELVRQAPLLYLILSCNALAVSITFYQFSAPFLSALVPMLFCVIFTSRGIWWSRRRLVNFSDSEVFGHIRNTHFLVTGLTLTYVGWAMLLYPHGNMAARGHLIFILALTQISIVTCLLPLRSVALTAATVSNAPLLLYFLFVDNGKMITEAVMLTIVVGGLVVILNRYNDTFSNLIRSERSLRQRQIETERLSEENHRIAFADALSGLPNRRAFMGRLSDVFETRKSECDTLCVVFIDLDGFKAINDVHGHEIGDDLIVSVGNLLKQIEPADGMLVRMGGDEFALLIAAANASSIAELFAAQALNRLEEPMNVSGRKLKIGASIGIAINDAETGDPSDLLRRADVAMYDVKENGKGGIQVYGSELDAERIARRRIEREIGIGLLRSEFDVVYQPLIDAIDSRVVGVEALVRWPGRPAGPLNPDEFIDIAEGCGLIQPLGMYVLERACREVRDIEGLRLSVNVSPAQLCDREFENEVRRVLVTTRFEPDRLQLEITESLLIDYPERAKQTIEALQKLGVSFALDDFGTGFTSLAYLLSYRFSCVKLDKSLAQRLVQDSDAKYIISGLVQMAKGLKVRVVAEGVETEELALLLKAAGCHELQGYFFGRPAPLEALKFAAVGSTTFADAA